MVSMINTKRDRSACDLIVMIGRHADLTNPCERGIWAFRECQRLCGLLERERVLKTWINGDHVLLLASSKGRRLNMLS